MADMVDNNMLETVGINLVVEGQEEFIAATKLVGKSIKSLEEEINTYNNKIAELENLLERYNKYNDRIANAKSPQQKGGLIAQRNRITKILPQKTTELNAVKSQLEEANRQKDILSNLEKQKTVYKEFGKIQEEIKGNIDGRIVTIKQENGVVKSVTAELEKQKVEAKNFGKEVEVAFSKIDIGGRVKKRLSQPIITKIETDDVKGIKKIYTEKTVLGKKTQEIYEQVAGEEKLYKISSKQSREQNKQYKLFNKSKAGRIKRILQYKVIAALFRTIIKTATQGFSLLTNYTKLTDSLTTIKSSITAISTSIASMLTPAIQTLSNLFQPLADEMLYLANSRAKANAIAKGESTYYKLSASAIREYSDSLREVNSQLTQLDKFATLSKGGNILGTYVDINEAVETDPFEKISENIDNATDSIKTAKKEFSAISTIITDFVDTIDFLTDKIDKMGLNIGDVLFFVGMSFAALKSTAGATMATIMSIMVLASKDASASSKAIAAAVMTIAGAYIGLGVAKQFAINPALGAAAGAASGALTAGIIAVVSSLVNSVGGRSTGNVGSSLNVGYTYGYDRMANSGYYPTSQYDFATQLGDSISSGVSNGMADNNKDMNVTIPIYIGGKKLDTVTQAITYQAAKNSSVGRI